MNEIGKKTFSGEIHCLKKSKKRSKFDASIMERKLVLFVGNIINFVCES